MWALFHNGENRNFIFIIIIVIIIIVIIIIIIIINIIIMQMGDQSTWRRYHVREYGEEWLGCMRS